MKNKQPLIRLVNIVKEYKLGEVTLKVIKGISLLVNTGDFIAITGRSGSGKSTLMNIMGLLDMPTSGQYFLEGQLVSKFSEDQLSDLRNKKIGFVFQSFNLLPRSTVLENIMLPGVYKGLSRRQREERAKLLLEQFGLNEEEQKHPNQLSGGQQQRVAIARSLMNEPEIILADEPTGNLDTKSGSDVINILKNLNKNGKTIILITHERDIAKHAKKMITLLDGRIVDHGTI